MKTTDMKFTVLLFVVLPFLFVSCQNGEPEQNEGYKQLDSAAFDAALAAETDPQLIDVRTRTEYERGHLPGARLLDIRERKFAEGLQALDKSRPVYVYCQSGGRSARACSQLTDLGFERVVELKDGYGGR